jgi:hypothetical protein
MPAGDVRERGDPLLERARPSARANLRTFFNRLPCAIRASNMAPESARYQKALCGWRGAGMVLLSVVEDW